MKFSFVPQTFIRIFFFRIRISLWNSLEEVIHYMLKISTKFGVAPQSFCENQNSVQNQDQDQDHGFHFGFQYQTYISFIKDTHQILCRSSESFESYCVHMQSLRTYVHPDIQTDIQTEIFFGLFCLLRNTNHEHSSKGENFFFHSCDYNTFSFYILRMWWESKNAS